MQKRGPYRFITRSEKIGKHGMSTWLVELECDHILKLNRKPPRNRVCCPECLDSAAPAEINVLDMNPILDSAKLAHRLGVDSSQVAIHDEGAQVLIDSFQLKKLLG